MIRNLLLGLVLGMLILPLCALFYLHYGNPPVATTDPSFPFEAQIVHVPLKARIAREMPKVVPIEPSETNLEIGAHIYRQQCASCHGLYGRPSAFAKHMYPDAPPLWEPHGHGVVGVSDDPPGETYWKIDNGIRLTGMPAYREVLNSTQMWQVALLLANADKPQSTAVMNVLKEPLNLDTSGSSQTTSPLPQQ